MWMAAPNKPEDARSCSERHRYQSRCSSPPPISIRPSREGLRTLWHPERGGRRRGTSPHGGVERVFGGGGSSDSALDGGIACDGWDDSGGVVVLLGWWLMVSGMAAEQWDAGRTSSWKVVVVVAVVMWCVWCAVLICVVALVVVPFSLVQPLVCLILTMLLKTNVLIWFLRIIIFELTESTVGIFFGRFHWLFLKFTAIYRTN